MLGQSFESAMFISFPPVNSVTAAGPAGLLVPPLTNWRGFIPVGVAAGVSILHDSARLAWRKARGCERLPRVCGAGHDTVPCQRPGAPCDGRRRGARAPRRAYARCRARKRRPPHDRDAGGQRPPSSPAPFFGRMTRRLVLVFAGQAMRSQGFRLGSSRARSPVWAPIAGTCRPAFPSRGGDHLHQGQARHPAPGHGAGIWCCLALASARPSYQAIYLCISGKEVHLPTSGYIDSSAI
jgi:hypothetical protein